MSKNKIQQAGLKLNSQGRKCGDCERWQPSDPLDIRAKGTCTKLQMTLGARTLGCEAYFKERG